MTSDHGDGQSTQVVVALLALERGADSRIRRDSANATDDYTIPLFVNGLRYVGERVNTEPSL